jgi:hypothetical protein
VDEAMAKMNPELAIVLPKARGRKRACVRLEPRIFRDEISCFLNISIRAMVVFGQKGIRRVHGIHTCPFRKISQKFGLRRKTPWIYRNPLK